MVHAVSNQNAISHSASRAPPVTDGPAHGPDHVTCGKWSAIHWSLVRESNAIKHTREGGHTHAHAFTYPDRQTDRQTRPQTRQHIRKHAHAHIQTYTHTHIHTHTQTHEHTHTHTLKWHNLQLWVSGKPGTGQRVHGPLGWWKAGVSGGGDSLSVLAYKRRRL